METKPAQGGHDATSGVVQESVPELAPEPGAEPFPEPVPRIENRDPSSISSPSGSLSHLLPSVAPS